MPEIKVYNRFNAPKGKKVSHGEEIYKWKYLDKDGKIQTESRNIKEQINSYLSTVDYKAQIARGEIDANGNVQSISRDFTAIPDNTVDIIDFLGSLASMDQGQVSNILEQFKKGSQESIQSKQETDSSGIKTKTTTGEASQSQSSDSEDNSTIDGGGQ